MAIALIHITGYTWPMQLEFNPFHLPIPYHPTFESLAYPTAIWDVQTEGFLTSDCRRIGGTA